MIVGVIILSVMVLWCMLMFAKTDNAYENHKKIMDAIETYVTVTSNAEMAIKMLMRMEDMEKTTWRFWDWGYKNILPKQYFELIEPYID